MEGGKAKKLFKDGYVKECIDQKLSASKHMGL